ncbi:GNAT family N-acetyltransferase [Nonomuraea deserti]|uniref:GNAT family N-acetyltransferase n=1 Tax=Nonomuraea deserti TaxID=1848322 RepID=A0A4V2YAI6_9ACTN|nr:GNAT family N-acetyltransferase [Nonomuraea deserti]TDD03956.1 GNAT family N-acetyltransferase [Nonomuraea deserti]
MAHTVRAAQWLTGSAAGLAEAAEVATAALTLDTAEAAGLIGYLSRPPAGRKWTALTTDGGVVMVSMSTKDTDAATDDGAPAGHIDLLAVHPSAQGQGRGRALVRAAEEWLAGQGARQARFAGNTPCYAWPGIDVRYTAAACLAERLGYERYSVAWNMTADLSVDLSVEDDVERLARHGVTVRAAGDDRARVTAFVREHFNDSWAWEAAHAAGVHYGERDGRVLGFAAWGARPAWFGPTGTAPDARGLGLGRVLLRRCLADQRAAGQAEAQIGWVGPLRFYSRAVGARAERVFWLYRRDLA